MAFFIALYGISHSDSKKFNEFLKGLGAFGNPAAANSGILKGGPSIVGVGTGVGQANPGSVTVGSSGGSALGTGGTPAQHPLLMPARNPQLDEAEPTDSGQETKIQIDAQAHCSKRNSALKPGPNAAARA